MATQWLRADTRGRPVGIDREGHRLNGYIVAQEGIFKTARGEFDGKSLKAIHSLMKAQPQGLKVRFGHPTLSDDGLGKHLGRARNPRIDKDGDTQLVRADLVFSKMAREAPAGDLESYVLGLAEDDPNAISSSLVLDVDQEYRVNKDGTLKRDENDEILPPLWRPVEVHASDIVDTGDAVDGLLSASLDASLLPDKVVREVCCHLDAQFTGRDREFVEQHMLGFVQRYLSWRFPGNGPVTEGTELDLLRRRIDAMELRLNSLRMHHMQLSHSHRIDPNEPPWESIATRELPTRACVGAYFHHWVRDGGEKDGAGRYLTGRLLLHRGGLQAALARAESDNAPVRIMRHLRQHAAAVGLT